MNETQENTCIKNAPNMIAVYSIFAAIAGVLLVFVLDSNSKYFYEDRKLPIFFFISSFFLFALAAERASEAVQERDEKKRIAYMFLYNIGVIFLFLGGALLIKYNNLSNTWWLIMILFVLEYIIWFWQRHVRWVIIPILLAFLASTLYSKVACWLLAVLVSTPWVEDAVWLIFSDNKIFKDYFKITDDIIMSPDDRLWVQIFYTLRNRANRMLSAVIKHMRRICRRK